MPFNSFNVLRQKHSNESRTKKQKNPPRIWWKNIRKKVIEKKKRTENSES